MSLWLNFIFSAYSILETKRIHIYTISNTLLMKTFLIIVSCFVTAFSGFGQINPAITSWLQNTSITGTYYVSGNSTAIANNILVNCQAVQYSANNVYVSTKGVPAYPTGPFLDGNPSNAIDQSAIFKFPLSPVQNTGTATSTTGGNIGVFINGVALFDYRDGVAWNPNTSALCGGPGNPSCPGGMGTAQAWNRDAIPAEMDGFDCSKGHPAMGNYHHHQNPSAFDLDLDVLSTICNLYDSNGLYAMNSSQHSPLIGYAYDGFPIYGSYGYLNLDGTGGITRIKSGYQLRNISVRTHWADGTDVADGPAVSSTYPLGYFREDYEYISHPGQNDYLDIHNGRICTTPEYPNGIYCYFATVDANRNSAYPYVVGPTFYGVKSASKVTSITESVTTYNAPLPLTLLGFDCLKREKQIDLVWSTSSEVNSSHFEIERSGNGYDFKKIGEVICFGNSNSEIDYEFSDFEPLPKTSYYRLKQVDYDEKYEYSKIVNVTNDKIDNFKAFFSSQAGLIVIENSGLNKQDCPVHLYDAMGRLVKTTSFLAGVANTFIDTQTLYDGTYFLIIREVDKNTSFKLSVKNI